MGEGRGEESGLISIDNVSCFSSMNFDIALEGRKDSVQSQPRQSNIKYLISKAKSQGPKAPGKLMVLSLVRLKGANTKLIPNSALR